LFGVGGGVMGSGAAAQRPLRQQRIAPVAMQVGSVTFVCFWQSLTCLTFATKHSSLFSPFLSFFVLNLPRRWRRSGMVPPRAAAEVEAAVPATASAAASASVVVVVVCRLCRERTTRGYLAPQ
jgi:hypothetical protein